MFKYQVFGLNVVSEIDLPELTLSDFSKADLHIRKGKVPPLMKDYVDRGTFYYAAPGRFLFSMDSVAKYMVKQGEEIIIEREKDALDSEVKLFLTGSVFGAMLLQRGYTPLHGCAISKDDQALIICGKSGAGKSSLAAEFIQQGYYLLADDISVIDIQDKLPIVRKGIQLLKLWEDTVKTLHIDTGPGDKLRPSLNKYRKSYEDKATPACTILGAIVLLDTKNSPGFSVEELFGVDKFNCLRSNIYRGIYIEPLDASENIFVTLSRLLEKVRVFRVVRPITPLKIKELAKFVKSTIHAKNNPR